MLPVLLEDDLTLALMGFLSWLAIILVSMVNSVVVTGSSATLSEGSNEVKTGELARRAQISPETVRYYERCGLLPPPERTDANYRRFGQQHLERLEFIRRCRRLGIDLRSVSNLLAYLDEPCSNCQGVNDILDEHVIEIDDQIRHLQALRQQLLRLRAACPGNGLSGECGILRTLSPGDVGASAGEPDTPPATCE